MNRFLQIFFVIVSGEAIFMLPFLIPRIYRPLMLDAWNLSNTDIGVGFAAYGITSTISYLLGGPYADKYNPKVLLSSSLAVTALSVFYLVSYPSPLSFTLTYAFLGVSTVLLMWGALIKTTHVLGGESNRSAALGVLDAGRGFAAALAGSALLLVVAARFPDLGDQQLKVEALRWIYFFVIGFLLVLAILVWICLNDLKIVERNEADWTLKKALETAKDSRVWLLSIIILSSYCGYKSIDNYSIYLADVHRQSVERTSELMSIILWIRPLSTLVIGVLADIFHRSGKRGRFHTLTFLLLAGAVCEALLALYGGSGLFFAFSTMLTSVIFIYGLRAVYFSVFGDLQIKNYLLGTTVGIVSFVGFLPDIFFGYISGRLVDTYPGDLGFHYTFLFTAACLFLGFLASAFLTFKTGEMHE